MTKQCRQNDDEHDDDSGLIMSKAGGNASVSLFDSYSIFGGGGGFLMEFGRTLCGLYKIEKKKVFFL